MVLCAGHTSWSTSGLGYLTFWLAGKLRIYDGSGHSWRLPASMVPLGGAVWIGITRLEVHTLARNMKVLMNKCDAHTPCVSGPPGWLRPYSRASSSLKSSTGAANMSADSLILWQDLGSWGVCHSVQQTRGGTMKAAVLTTGLLASLGGCHGWVFAGPWAGLCVLSPDLPAHLQPGKGRGAHAAIVGGRWQRGGNAAEDTLR